jgi:hypothetical protein
VIASSIVGALEKLVLIADYYDETLRMTCDVQEINAQVRRILVTVNKVMVNLDDIDDASMRDLEELRLTAVRAMMTVSAPPANGNVDAG